MTGVLRIWNHSYTIYIGPYLFIENGQRAFFEVRNGANPKIRTKENKPTLALVLPFRRASVCLPVSR